MAQVESVDRALAAGEQARMAGRSAVASIRRSVSERLADLILSDPDWAAQAAEVGLVDRSWLDDPARRPFRTAPLPRWSNGSWPGRPSNDRRYWRPWD